MNIAWDMNTLVTSYWGMYAVQTVLHSVVASVIVDGALLAWNIKTPHVRQRFRFLIIFLPLVLFPLYQSLSPERGGIYFRLESLLDSDKWFFLDLRGVSALTIFVIILALTSVIFIIQELIPIFFDMVEKMRGADESVDDGVEESCALKVSKALKGLPFDEGSVEIMKDEDLALFSSTGLKPKIYVSTGLIESFGDEHLHAALAHEIGHIQRSRKPVLTIAYILRMLMFYNPVAMIEFRKLAQDEEKVCDDIAIALTGNPEALFEAVDMLRPSPEDYKSGDGRGVSGITSALEHYSHDILLKSRSARVGHDRHEGASYWKIPYSFTVILIVGINYFVV